MITNHLALLFTGLITLLMGLGIHTSLSSPLFSVQQIEVDQPVLGAELEPGEVMAATAITVGEQSLFALDLRETEARLLGQDWISSVHLEKRFPQTLYVRPSYRQPIAGYLGSDGRLQMIDQEGIVFSPGGKRVFRDLPMVSGVDRGDRSAIQRSLRIVLSWAALQLDSVALLSTISPTTDGDFSLAVSYPGGRTQVVLGFEDDFDLELQLGRIKKVLAYLGHQRAPAKMVWANSGKKIVVKGALGS